MNMKKDALNCWQCGECCRDLIKGVEVTNQEWEALKEDINKLHLNPITIQKARRSLRLPTKGRHDSKRCIFLENRIVCQVYDKKPEECKRFPVWVIEGQKAVTFVVSSICPRAQYVAAYLENDLPSWAKKLVSYKNYRVVVI